MFETETGERGPGPDNAFFEVRRFIDGPANRILRSLVTSIHVGRLTIEMPNGQVIDQAGDSAELHAKICLRNMRTLRRIFLAGAAGFADSYIDGDWSTPDLSALLHLLGLNHHSLSPRIRGTAIVRLYHLLRHRSRANTLEGSRRNIPFHYDLGNDFYRSWLDPDLIYSSAIYQQEAMTLEEAQAAKINRILSWVDAAPDDRVLEIGCGWGALSRRLGENGARVTAITLSTQQFSHANALIEESGIAHNVRVRLQDYRDVGGEFDKIVSIEMMEAVGEEYWPRYFGVIRDRLKPGGRAVLQVITINERRYDIYRQEPDFIQRHIFPGGMLPTKARIFEQGESAGLSVVATEAFGLSYARTLSEWRSRFMRAWPALQAQGFCDRFRRSWEYYLTYCEAGFRSGTLDVGLYVLTKQDR